MRYFGIIEYTIQYSLGTYLGKFRLGRSRYHKIYSNFNVWETIRIYLKFIPKGNTRGCKRSKFPVHFVGECRLVD